METTATHTRRAALGTGLAALGIVAACGQAETPIITGRAATDASVTSTRTERAAERVLAAQPRTVPRARGLDPAGLARLLEAADALPQLNALVVARGGEVLVDEAFRGPATTRPVNIKSASKTVLATVAGLAIADGVLDGLEQRVAPLLDVPNNADARVGDITVEHLLSMRAGLESTSGRNYGPWAVSRNPVAHALARPMVDAPGGRMIYSTGTSHLLSAALTSASGESTLALSRRLLGEPLGIDIPSWPRDPRGIYYGGNDMRLSPRDLLRFGELFRLGGTLDGTDILPEGWIADAWRPRGRSRWSGDGYGLGWWLRSIGGFRVPYAWGYGGQMLYVVPELEMTVAMTSLSDPAQTRRGHVRSLHGLMRDHVVPAAVRGDPALL